MGWKEDLPALDAEQDTAGVMRIVLREMFGVFGVVTPYLAELEDAPDDIDHRHALLLLR